MPPCARLPGWGGDGGMPPPWEDDGELFGDDPDDEELDGDPDAEEIDAEEEEEQPVPIAGLNDIDSIINRPDDFPGRNRVCIVGVLFMEAPLMLQRLREADAAGVGIMFVGNLDLLRQADELHAGLARLSGYLKSLHSELRTDMDGPLLRRAQDDDPRLPPVLGTEKHLLRRGQEDDDPLLLPALGTGKPLIRRGQEEDDDLLLLPAKPPLLRRGQEDDDPPLGTGKPVLCRAQEEDDDPLLLPALGTDMPPLLRHAQEEDARTIAWPVIRRGLQDYPPLLAALCEAQPEGIRGRVLQLLERVKTMVKALPGDNADAADAPLPNHSDAALASTVALLLEDAEAL